MELREKLASQRASGKTRYGRDSRDAEPPILNYRSSLLVIASPALFSSRLIDKPVKATETDTRPTASTGSAPGPSTVASASETSTSRMIGETIIRLMIV